MGRLSALSVFIWNSILYGDLLWARMALNGPKRWFLARPVADAELCTVPGLRILASQFRAGHRRFL
jgi:hypothetical protein